MLKRLIVIFVFVVLLIVSSTRAALDPVKDFGFLFDFAGSSLNKSKSTPRYLGWDIKQEELFVFDTSRLHMEIYSLEGVLKYHYRVKQMGSSVNGFAVLKDGGTAVLFGDGRIHRYSFRGESRGVYDMEGYTGSGFSVIFSDGKGGFGVLERDYRRIILVPLNGKPCEVSLPDNTFTLISDIYMANGRFYVLDITPGRVSVLDGYGKTLYQFGYKGGSTGKHSQPVGIAADALGVSYVVDSRRSLVTVWDPGGSFTQEFGGGEASDRGWLFYPGDIEVHPSGRLYVADTQNSRVSVFASDDKRSVARSVSEQPEVEMVMQAASTPAPTASATPEAEPTVSPEEEPMATVAPLPSSAATAEPVEIGELVIKESAAVKPAKAMPTIEPDTSPLRQEEFELAYEGPRAERSSFAEERTYVEVEDFDPGRTELRIPENLVKDDSKKWTLDIVDEKGDTVRSYRYRRLGESEMRVDGEGLLLEVVDKRGKTLESRRLRGMEASDIRWGEIGEIGGIEENKMSFSYELRVVDKSGQQVEVDGPLIGLAQGAMFSLPKGGVVPGLAGNQVGVQAGKRDKVTSASVLVTDKKSGKAVRRIDYGKELPKSISWDGRDDAGELMPSDRDYSIKLAARDQHGLGQVAVRDVYPIYARVSGIEARGIIFRAEAVRFQYNKTVLKKADAVKLEKMVSVVKLSPRIKVEVEGFSDDMGSYRYNKQLSWQRALAVKQRLIELGIAEEQLIVKSRGPINPVASNLTEQGRAANRRVELAMLVPFDVAGMVYDQAGKMLAAPPPAWQLKKGQRIAVLPFPARAGGKKLHQDFKDIFVDVAGMKLAEENELVGGLEGEAADSLEQLLVVARKRKLDWVLCAARSKEATLEHLVVELIDVKLGKSVVSESAVIGQAGEAGRELLLRMRKHIESRIAD